MAIKSFKHKGLKKFFYDGDTAGIQGNHLQKVGYIRRDRCITSPKGLKEYLWE